MSEQDRSRLYDWWCEHADEALAEYAMSCLSPVPLPDLATKEDLRDVKADVREVKEDLRQVKSDVARVDAKVDALAVRMDEKFDRVLKLHEADSETAGKRHKLLVGAAIVLAAEIVAAEAGWLRWFTDLLASAI
ncbi:MAG: hypothetical protein F4190_09270 [Acidimicrobiales bacterium]|nr:hypothetical protein [Acidimicrobiales bacterium]MYG88706.1 hypothetical protein [Acidimicrobiales bacterium]MYI26949.1 hypothetical protein [Acidimicrobiales bacterium]